MLLRDVPKCVKCGSPKVRLIEVTREGLAVAAGCMCSPCLEKAIAVADELRRQFEELLELGISRELANEVMCDRMDRRAAAIAEGGA